MTPQDARQYAPATERNREPILEVLSVDRKVLRSLCQEYLLQWIVAKGSCF